MSADLYMLDDLLGDAERDVRDRVRAFARDEVLPVINAHWEAATFPHELVPKLAELGVAGGWLEGHGCPGLSRLGAGVVTRELARADGSFNTFYGVHSGLAMGAIGLLGSEEQRARWLPPMARLETIGAFALTEPEHGSDSVALECAARRAPGGGWVLRGRKRWIGNAAYADVVVVWARDAETGRVGAFLVRRDDAGFDASATIDGKVGKRAILQSDVVLDDVFVPEDRRLAGAESFRDAARVLESTRGGAAWECVGHAEACYEAALAHAGAREQFGRPLAGFQLVQERLATMLADTVAMQLLCFRLAALQEAGQATGAMASLAKLHNVRRAKAVCGAARDVFGGNGLLLEHHVARHLTDMEVVDAYEGTDSMQALIVGRAVTGVSAFA